MVYKTDVPVPGWQSARGLLAGTYDLHMHTGPSIFPRRADDREALAEAVDAKMAGIGFKAHEGDTVARAKLLNDGTSACKVYGGIVLNHFVGGLNPAAVEASLKMGGRIVWLPTVSSAQHIGYYNSQGIKFLGESMKYNAGEGICIVGEDGKLAPVMYEIFDLVRDAGAILSTGHLSPAESLAVARGFGESKGDGFVVFGHPDVMLNQASLEAQQEFVRLGGYVEKCTLALKEGWGEIALETYAEGIKAIGIERCFLTSDAGFKGHPSSPEILTRFIALVLEKKLLTEKEIRTLLVDIPEMLIGV